MARFKFYVSAGPDSNFVEENIEIPSNEIEGMTNEQMNQYVNDNYFQGWLSNHDENAVNSGFSKIDD